MIPRRFSRDTLVLLILPILFVAILFAMRTVSLPLWQQFNLDPDYYYLLNGLRLVEGLALVALTIPAVRSQTAELARWTRAAQSFDMSRFAACAKIDYDTASSLPYALLRGDLNAQGRYSPQLARLMPADTYAWFVNDHTWWSHGFMHWTRRLDIATETAAYPCLVFRGSQPYIAIPLARREIPGFRLDDQCEIGDETVFTMGITCAGEPINRPSTTPQ
jgi:hypothetical protein